MARKLRYMDGLALGVSLVMNGFMVDLGSYNQMLQLATKEFRSIFYS